MWTGAHWAIFSRDTEQVDPAHTPTIATFYLHLTNVQ